MKASGATRNQERSEKCLRLMYDMRPRLCDVTLITEDGHRVPGHRIVIAAALQYFSAMFTGSGPDGSNYCYIESDKQEILIRNIDGQALNSIIKWCYTGIVETDEDNVQQLLSGAKMLDCNEIVVKCTDFMKSQLHPENVLGIYAFAEMLGCTDLQSFSLNYIYNNFTQITQASEEFMQLSSTRLIEIISSDFIDTGDQGEQVVLSSVMAWIDHEQEPRKQYLSALIEHIRFPRLSQETLVDIEDTYPLLKTDTRCKDLLIEAMKYHLCKGQMASSLANSSRFKLRSPRGKPNCLLVVGGQAPKAIKQCEFYDFSTEQWYEIPSELPTRRCRAGVAVCNGLVYAIGGFNGSLRVRTVDCYDPQTNQWSSCASMEARRSTLGVCVLNNLIYAVGGFDGSAGLQSAEVYDPSSGTWHFIAPMSTKRSSVGVAALNEYIYAVGGYDGASRQCLSSVEYYNPCTDSWHLIPDMSQRRSGAGVGVLDNKLYAIGGHDGPAVRKSVECYDPIHNCWMQCADMIVARRNAGVVSRDGLLFVVGGDDGQSNLASVEVYNPKLNTWTWLKQEMSIGRSYAGVCIIDKFWS